MKSSLPKKLAAGFAVVLLLLVIVGIVGTVAVTTLGDTADQVITVSGRLNALALEINIHNQAARRFEKDFLLASNRIGVAKARETFATLVPQETEAMRRLALEAATTANAPSDRERFQTLVQSSAAYDAAFAKMVEATERRGYLDTGAQGEFSEAARAIEEMAKAKNDDRLMLRVLSLRRSEKDYLLRGEQKYVQSTQENLERLKSSIADLPDASFSAGDKAGLRLLADRYIKAFSAVVDADRTVATSLLAADAASSEMTRSANAGSQAGQVASNLALYNIRETQRTSLVMVFCIAAAGLVVGALTSVLLSRSIVGPIKYLTEVAERVSLGDTELTVTRQSTDEIGDLAESFGRLVTSVRIMRDAMGDNDNVL